MLEEEAGCNLYSEDRLGLRKEVTVEPRLESQGVRLADIWENSQRKR